MNDGISFAKEMLEKYGEFHPYGRSMNHHGAIANVSAYDGDEYPPGAELLGLLENGLRQKVRSDQDIAIATFTNVSLRDEQGEAIDAVQVGLEHKDGYSINVYYPFTIDNGEVSFGELIAMEREPNVFV